jgi:hypothetical protein
VKNTTPSGKTPQRHQNPFCRPLTSLSPKTDPVQYYVAWKNAQREANGSRSQGTLPCYLAHRLLGMRPDPHHRSSWLITEPLLSSPSNLERRPQSRRYNHIQSTIRLIALKNPFPTMTLRRDLPKRASDRQPRQSSPYLQQLSVCRDTLTWLSDVMSHPGYPISDYYLSRLACSVYSLRVPGFRNPERSTDSSFRSWTVSPLPTQVSKKFVWPSILDI